MMPDPGGECQDPRGGDSHITVGLPDVAAVGHDLTWYLVHLIAESRDLTADVRAFGRSGRSMPGNTAATWG